MNHRIAHHEIWLEGVPLDCPGSGAPVTRGHATDTRDHHNDELMVLCHECEEWVAVRVESGEGK